MSYEIGSGGPIPTAEETIPFQWIEVECDGNDSVYVTHFTRHGKRKEGYELNCRDPDGVADVVANLLSDLFILTKRR